MLQLLGNPGDGFFFPCAGFLSTRIRACSTPTLWASFCFSNLSLPCAVRPAQPIAVSRGNPWCYLPSVPRMMSLSTVPYTRHGIFGREAHAHTPKPSPSFPAPLISTEDLHILLIRYTLQHVRIVYTLSASNAYDPWYPIYDSRYLDRPLRRPESKPSIPLFTKPSII